MTTLSTSTEDGIKNFGLTTKRIPRDSKLVWLVFKNIKIPIFRLFFA